MTKLQESRRSVLALALAAGAGADLLAATAQAADRNGVGDTDMGPVANVDSAHFQVAERFARRYQRNPQVRRQFNAMSRDVENAARTGADLQDRLNRLGKYVFSEGGGGSPQGFIIILIIVIVVIIIMRSDTRKK
jgi:hypothetical protein